MFAFTVLEAFVDCSWNQLGAWQCGTAPSPPLLPCHCLSFCPWRALTGEQLMLEEAREEPDQMCRSVRAQLGTENLSELWGLPTFGEVVTAKSHMWDFRMRSTRL